MPNYQYINGTINISSPDTNKLVETYESFKNLLKKEFPHFVLTQYSINLKGKDKTIFTKVRGSGFIRLEEIIALVKKIKRELAPFSIKFQLNTWEEDDIIHQFRIKQKIENSEKYVRIETPINFHKIIPVSTEKLRTLMDLNGAVVLSEGETFIQTLSEFYHNKAHELCDKEKLDQMVELIELLQMQYTKNEAETIELLNQHLKNQPIAQHYEEFLQYLEEGKIIEKLIDVFKKQKQLNPE